MTPRQYWGGWTIMIILWSLLAYALLLTTGRLHAQDIRTMPLNAPTRAVVTTLSADGEHVQVTHTAGAVGACTVFQQQTLSTPDIAFPDGHYTPRKCWFDDAGSKETTYESDWQYIKREQTPWLVWSEVQYEEGKELVTIVSNKVATVR